MILLLAALAQAAEVSFGTDGLRVEDGKSTLELHTVFQPRGILSIDPRAEGAEALVGSGFRLRRMQLVVEGTLAGTLDFKLQLENRSALQLEDGQVQGPVLNDAWVAVPFSPGVRLTVGQMKVPYSAQWLTSGRYLAFPERAVTHDPLSPGRDLGLVLDGQTPEGRVTAALTVMGGEGSNVWPSTDPGLRVGARVVVAPLGEVPLDELDLERGPPRVALGISGLRDHQPLDDVVRRDDRGGVELRYAGRGLVVAAEGYVRRQEGREVEPLLSGGGYAQASLVIPALHLAPAVRLARFESSRETPGGRIDTWVPEIGLSWMLPRRDTEARGDDFGHSARLQAGWAVHLTPGEVERYVVGRHVGTLGLQLTF